MKNYKISVIIVTLFLLVFTISSRIGTSLDVLLFMFSLSPFLLIWMVYSVLKYGKYNVKPLAEDEEWGYEDITKDQLGTF